MKGRFVAVLASILVLSGCTFGGSTPPKPIQPTNGSIWKSFDKGETFTPKVVIDEKRYIANADILTLRFDPSNTSVVYAGTVSDGIFRTKDAGEHWEKMNYVPERVYGIAVDPSNPDRIFASGVYQKIGKIYRTDDGGANWKEVYSEPGPETVISVLTMHPTNSDILYAATDKGVTIKTIDGGENWENVYVAKAPVTRITLGPQEAGSVVLLVHEKGVIYSPDGGKEWEDYTTYSGNIDLAPRPERPVSLTADPRAPNVLYVGTFNKGMSKSTDFGKTWTTVKVIESADTFPIRSIAVHPGNSSEISFVSGAVFYRSTDGGVTWNVTKLSIDRGVSALLYDTGNADILYFGLRKF